MNAPTKKMTRDLSRLLSPRSVAFIGGGECDVAIARTRDLGFTGKIWAVHPKRDNLGGIPCVRSVDDIDGIPDAAFVAVRREPTIEVVRALRAKGCGGAVIYASGFAETGDAHLQDELLAADGLYARLHNTQFATDPVGEEPSVGEGEVVLDGVPAG